MRGWPGRQRALSQPREQSRCSRTTLWRAYYGSKAFRHRVWWERQALNRESDLRLASLRAQVTEQIERLVSAGDPSTVRWLAERLGLFKEFDAQPGKDGRENTPAAAPSAKSPDLPPAAPQPAPPAASADLADTAEPFDDDSVPGALRERTLPNPAEVAAILARPESEGPKGVYPWTYNPDDAFPNLGSALERRGGQGAFTRRR
jgi:hypothetical protein